MVQPWWLCSLPNHGYESEGLPRTGEADSSTKLNSPRIFYASLGVLKMSWWKTFLENIKVNFMIKGKNTHFIWAICKLFYALVATTQSVVLACSGLSFVFTGIQDLRQANCQKPIEYVAFRTCVRFCLFLSMPDSVPICGPLKSNFINSDLHKPRLFTPVYLERIWPHWMSETHWLSARFCWYWEQDCDQLFLWRPNQQDPQHKRCSTREWRPS